MSFCVFWILNVSAFRFLFNFFPRCLVCDLLEFRDAESQPSVIAIFAPQDPLLACLVQSFADLYLIPVIHFGETYQLDKTPNSMYVNMYPHFLTIKRLLKDTISFFHWNDFAIFYTDEKSKEEESWQVLPG